MILLTTDNKLSDEFDAVRKWASVNKIIINISKTEINVVPPPQPNMDVYSCILQKFRNKVYPVHS